ncbi:unnamed protein product [Ectocarpus fasciculatus]
MPGLESTMICLDNSEWMRNGDHFPTRLDAQQDAVNLLMTARTDSHPENTVGILTMAGKGVEMLVSPTEDMKKLLAVFGKISIRGQCQFCNSVQIAHLALKHRKNKNGGQRIIVFIGSPVEDSEEAMKKIGKVLKKNNVAVDVVVVGEPEAIQSKVLAFVNAANSNDNSHLITVPPEVNPAEAIMSSPILGEFGGGFGGGMDMGGGDAGGASAGGGGGQFADYGGVDPSLDPELAMALRASAEEARAAEAARGAAVASEVPTTGGFSPEESIPGGADEEDDEDAVLQAALAISMQGVQATESAAPAAPAPDAAPAPEAAAEMEVDDDDEEEAMRAALLLSMGDSSAPAAAPAPSASTPSPAPAAAPAAGAYMDADFVNQLLGSVDVDPNDPFIAAAREQLNAAQAEQKGKEEKKDDSNK